MKDLSAGWIWFETDETQDIFARARRKFTISSPESARVYSWDEWHY